MTPLGCRPADDCAGPGVVCDASFGRLKQHLVEWTGLAYYADKDADLSRRIGRRLSSLGIGDCASYLNILFDPARGPGERDALIAEVTIGETYFFRHAEHYAALREVVLPALIARNEGSRCLRIWCAGCADGAEAYSLAILLKREMGQMLAGWKINILGTDLSRRALALAREGVFQEWSLRATPEAVRTACFSKSGRVWSIAPEYKEWVSFQHHNMVEEPFPPPIACLSAPDLIVCRNVMIYFGADLMRRTVIRFHECMLPGAWLLVGPAEPNNSYFGLFRCVNAPGVTLYQKYDEPDPWRESQTPVAPAVPRLAPRAARTPADKVTEPTIEEIRRHADCGAWEKAAECCQRLLADDRLNSCGHFHYALILEQMNRRGEAEQSLRRVIYLDRGYVLAHYYLGLLLEARGERRQAERSFENVLGLLASREDAGVLAGGDGITVSEMRRLAETRLRTLGGPA